MDQSSFYSDYHSFKPYHYQSSSSSSSDHHDPTTSSSLSVHRHLTLRSIHPHPHHHYSPQLFKSNYLSKLFSLTLNYSERFKIVSRHHHDINSMSLQNSNSNFFLLTCGSDRRIELYNYSNFVYSNFDTYSINRNVYINRFDKNDHFTKMEIESCHSIKRNESPHQSTITHIQWYPYDSGMFFTSSLDGTLLIWDTQSMSSVLSFDCMSKINSFDMYGSGGGGGKKSDPNQNIIACALDDHSIKLCDLNSGASVQQFLGHSARVRSVKFSTQNEYLMASSGDDCTIRLWDVRTSGWLLCMDQFNVDDKKLDIFGNTNLGNTNLGNTNLGNTKNSNVVNRLKKRKKQDVSFSASKSYNYSNQKVPTAHNQSINSIKFSNCGNYLYSSGNDNKLMKWIVSSGKNTLFNCNVLNSNSSACQIIEQVPNSNLLLHASYNRIELFGSRSGQLIRKLPEIHYDSIKSICLDWENQLLFSAGCDHSVEVWDSNLNVIDQEKGGDGDGVDGDGNIENIQDQDDWDV